MAKKRMKSTHRSFHAGFSHDGTRVNNSPKSIGFTNKDLLFLQALGRVH